MPWQLRHAELVELLETNSMSVGWLLDASVFDEYHDAVADAIVRNGFEARSINRPNPPYGWDDTESAYRKAFPAGACVVTHADIDLVNRVLHDARWIPGAFATVDHFFCSSYYARFRRYLLNQDHVMLPFATLRQRCNAPTCTMRDGLLSPGRHDAQRRSRAARRRRAALSCLRSALSRRSSTR